jgi:flavin-dependent dehydrogenase
MAAWLADCRFGNDRLTIRPAPAFVLDRICGRDWLAVGDAAAYDPIASQGIHKALSDGLLSAVAIADHLAGVRSALDGYAASAAAGFADYLNNRDYLYGMERRWPASTFWRNRVRAPSSSMP